MKSIQLFSVLLLSIFLMQSCTNDDTLNGGTKADSVAPELPPIQTLIMPFDGFEEADTTGFSPESNNRSVVSYKNWFYAASNLVLWNTVLTINLALPTASFAEAFNHDPIYAGNGIWQWIYVVNDNGQLYSCVLSGQQIDSEEVQFDMHVSKAGGFNNVNWYTANVKDNGETGTWVFNAQPNNPLKVLQLEYTTNNSGVKSIRFTNIKDNSPDVGDFIEFRDDNGATFDRAYDIYRSQTDNLLEIQWNETSKNGRVKSPEFFNDSDWNCWDEAAMDIDCL